ncbi:MAG: GyrI-like domain-containing protein [Thermoguttaceae bacterium]
MRIEIIETPIQFHLHGKSSAVPNHSYGEVGLRSMDELWKVVKQTRTATTGINHWVYLADGRMFVGVELLPNTQALVGLEPLRFELRRYLKHVHLGPYQALPEKWKALKDELAAHGETIGSPSLEVYGHHCDDPSKLETTILIGLQRTHG